MVGIWVFERLDEDDDALMGLGGADKATGKKRRVDWMVSWIECRHEPLSPLKPLP